MSFAIGQRWVSQAEFELGLGTVINADRRFVQIMFPGAEETRQYAIDQAPLMRVEYAPGDKIASLEDFEFIVESIENLNDTIIYHGVRIDNDEHVAVKEIMLDHHVKLNTPEARLFTGAYDRAHWFNLRLEAHQKKAELETFSLHGLLGARVGLIPHQLYIADTVGKRFAPRVLLADEVGLGKTIEAGLIIHQQLVTGRASRVLVILPASLKHQWLVEMLRRFNLKFSIFDDSRCQVESDSGSTANPFENEQLIFVSQEWLKHDDKWQRALTDAQWDLVVVDEAHHISPSSPNTDETNNSNTIDHIEAPKNSLYAAVEKIGRQTQGLILLTATPDQLGHYGHFKRLQLLDPDRFHSYEAYLEEESQYKDIAAIANKLISHLKLSEDEVQHLSLLLDDENNLMRIQQYQMGAYTDELIDSLISDLLDRHGTGRIMYRNSRQAISGFPERKLNVTELVRPASFAPSVEYLGPTPEVQHINDETALEPWQYHDPRVDWLCEFLKQNKSEKVLVICARAETAVTLDEALFEKEGLRTTVFHEGMSIIERDKAAAYFADSENSAQALICSEIGSEGRNFQFAHHLVLFDIPTNPDLLEQRIGRLDRIGQTETVQIHVPYIVESAQHKLLRLYHEAFNAFESTSTTARIVFEQHHEVLTELLFNTIDEAKFEAVLKQCFEQNNKLKLEVEKGRDKLLEINSGGGDKAQKIAEEIEQIDDSTELLAFLSQVWEHFGIQTEQRAAYSFILKPGEHMMTEHFPSLLSDGMTVCFDRDIALSNEDQHFMSWEHPMTTGVLDMLTGSDLGNASVCLLKNKKLPAGTCFVEMNFLITTNAPRRLQLQRFMPNTAVRVLLDKNGNNLADKVKQSSLDASMKNAKKSVSTQLIRAFKEDILNLVETGHELVNNQKLDIVEAAKSNLIEDRENELNRLVALQEINPAIRDDEITFLRTQLSQCLEELNSAQVQLDAIRLIVVDHN